MQTLKAKWNKELEVSVLPKQSVPKSSLDIRVWLVPQNIIFQTY